MKSKKNWYTQTWCISLVFSLSFLIVPFFLGLLLLTLHLLEARKEKKYVSSIESDLAQCKTDNQTISEDLRKLQKKYVEIGAERYEEVTEKVNELYVEKQELESDIESYSQKITLLKLDNENLNVQLEKTNKSLQTQKNKLSRIKELYKCVENAIERYNSWSPDVISMTLSEYEIADLNELVPSVMLKLHSLDVKDLKKAFKENEKLIDQVFQSYGLRYSTKSNQAIYQLMVIALRGELQNILFELKYENLEQAIENVQKTTEKYLKIAVSGNQNLLPSLTNFINDIETLFINAVKIEYNYYVKKEQAKLEQQALRQQMKEDAEERKLLEQQQKKMAQEEEKFNSEIKRAQELLTNEQDDSKLQELQAKILELQGQLSNVVLKKDEITRLANGKAGYVYVISNLGSFGESMFKIGMTRRLEPQARIDELGSASVPFRFDVHSLIFSENAVELENKLHTTLHDKRVNKVNRRKEFFHATIDELEELVNQIDPTAEFTRTMAAEEYRQSLSCADGYNEDDSLDLDDEE